MTYEQPQNWRVHLHSGITDAEFSLHLELICNAQTTKRLNAITTSALNAASVDSGSTRQTDPTSVHTAITNPNTSIIRHIFHVGDVRGYSGKFDKDIIETISRHPVVQHVQPVGVTNIAAVNWGLGAISHRSGSSPVYVHTSMTGNINNRIVVYVMDSGVHINHSAFSPQRATYGETFLSRDREYLNHHHDYHGHGTHVAGIIAGISCGVTESVAIVSVRVLDDDCQGRADDLSAGMQYIIRNARDRGILHKSVVNISIGCPHNSLLNEIINTGAALGLTIVVAAGNEGEASNRSPASASGAITVGATEQPKLSNGLTTVRWPDSNFGPNVDIFAPGEDILSCGNSSDTSYVLNSGTSMAAPHVAGYAAYLNDLDSNLHVPSAVRSHILGIATPDLVGDCHGFRLALSYLGFKVMCCFASIPRFPCRCTAPRAFLFRS